MVGGGDHKVVLDERGFSEYRVPVDWGLNFLSVYVLFDKLEVLECSAEAIIDSEPIGGHVPMSPLAIEEVRMAFEM